MASAQNANCISGPVILVLEELLTICTPIFSTFNTLTVTKMGSGAESRAFVQVMDERNVSFDDCMFYI